MKTKIFGLVEEIGRLVENSFSGMIAYGYSQ